MADLEDFFAKRDKKKKTKKFESVDIDDVAKVLDAKAKERKKMELYQPPEGSEAANDHGAKEDDDWKEIPDDTPDFTGLKIQEFSLEAEEEANAKEAEAREATDKESEGPWKMKKKSKPAEAAAPTVQPVQPAVVEVKPAVAIVEEKVRSESPEPKSLSSDKDEVGSQKSEKSEEGQTAPTPTPGGDGGPVKYMTPAQKKRAAEEAARGSAPPPTPEPKQTAAGISMVATPLSSGPAPTLAGSGGKYVPPSQRFGASSVSSAKAKPRKAAPNIESEQNFPSLSGS